MSQVAKTSAATHAHAQRRRALRLALVVGVVVALVTSPIALTGLAFWAADGNWTFAGRGLRHLIFIKGSTIDRLGVVEPTEDKARYVVRLADGTDPGESSMVYQSLAQPSVVITTYANRCRSLGLALASQSARAIPSEGTLVCQGNRADAAADDVWIHAAREAGSSHTHVHMRAGPGLTDTYSF